MIAGIFGGLFAAREPNVPFSLPLLMLAVFLYVRNADSQRRGSRFTRIDQRGIWVAVAAIVILLATRHMLSKRKYALSRQTFGALDRLVAACMAIERTNTLAMLNGFFADSALVWITGVFTLLVDWRSSSRTDRWSGGALAVLVTLYGWLAAIKGLSLIFFPAAMQSAFFSTLHFERYYYAYVLVAALLGGYLIYGGVTMEAGDP